MSGLQYSGREWSLTLPPATRLLTSNDRLHWAQNAREAARLRETFGWMARAQRIPPLPWAHAIYFIRVRGRFDPGNWAPTVKYAIDGLVDAGVLPDDSVRYLAGPDPRPGARRGFVLLIRELAAPPPAPGP